LLADMQRVLFRGEVERGGHHGRGALGLHDRGTSTCSDEDDRASPGAVVSKELDALAQFSPVKDTDYFKVPRVLSKG
jgi:hypothetical protein